MSYEGLDIRKIKKVRKEHCCEWCNFLIHIGQSAVYRVYLWEGEFTATHMHPECYEAMNGGDSCLEHHDDGEFEQGSYDQGGLVCDNCDICDD